MAARWRCPNRSRCSVVRIQDDLESKGRAAIGAPYKAIGNRARLRLGTPLPDATLDGKILPRRSPASGIQLNNAKGDEVGGMAMLDDGTMLLCFDRNGAEASCMYIMPTGEHGLWVGDDAGKDRARVMVTADNQTKVVLDGGTLKNEVLFLVGSNGATLLDPRSSRR
jgi:hypothetical protein